MAMEGSLIALVNRLQEACSKLGDLGVESGDLPSLYGAQLRSRSSVWPPKRSLLLCPSVPNT